MNRLIGMTYNLTWWLLSLHADSDIFFCFTAFSWLSPKPSLVITAPHLFSLALMPCSWFFPPRFLHNTCSRILELNTYQGRDKLYAALRFCASRSMMTLRQWAALSDFYHVAIASNTLEQTAYSPQYIWSSFGTDTASSRTATITLSTNKIPAFATLDTFWRRRWYSSP